MYSSEILDLHLHQIRCDRSGLGAAGTEAASEIVSNPAYTTLLLHNAPNWQSMNLDAVISTKVIRGEPGLFSVVIMTLW